MRNLNLILYLLVFSFLRLIEIYSIIFFCSTSSVGEFKLKEVRRKSIEPEILFGRFFFYIEESEFLMKPLRKLYS